MVARISLDGAKLSDTATYVKTGSEDINARSVVGEVGASIGEGGGTNGDGLLSGSRGAVATVKGNSISTM